MRAIKTKVLAAFEHEPWFVSCTVTKREGLLFVLVKARGRAEAITAIGRRFDRRSIVVEEA